MSYWTKSTADIDIGLYFDTSASLRLSQAIMSAGLKHAADKPQFFQPVEPVSRKELVASNACYWADTLHCKNLLIPQECHLSTEHFRRACKMMNSKASLTAAAAVVQRKLWIYSDAAFLCSLFSVHLIEIDVLLNEVCATKYLVDTVPLWLVSKRSCWFINENISIWHLNQDTEPHISVCTSVWRVLSVSTSLQQQLDVPRVVHSEPIAAGQGVEQWCFSFKKEFTKWRRRSSERSEHH